MPLHSKTKDAIATIQCPPPAQFSDEGLCHLQCARENCDYEHPELETRLGAGDKKIFFYHYEDLPTCSKCGSCEKGTTECPTCEARKGKGKSGKFGKQKQLLLKHETFDVFWNDHHLFHLKRHRIHH